MPFVIDPVLKMAAESRITSAAIDVSNDRILRCEQDGRAVLCDLGGLVIKDWSPEGGACEAVRTSSGFAIGTLAGDLLGIDLAGETIWTHPIGAGCEALAASDQGGLIICLDGTHELHLLSGEGQHRHSRSTGPLAAIAIDRHGKSVAACRDHGMVEVMDPEGRTTLERAPRHADGARITACCFDESGHLVLARETLSMAAQDEDEHEVEWWNPLGKMVERQGFRNRVSALASHPSGVIVGQHDGTISLCSPGQEEVVVWTSNYSIEGVRSYGSDLLVASWFQLHRLDLDPSEDQQPNWSIEHSGIVSIVETTGEGNLCLIGGEDMNDYTVPDPLILLDLDAEPRWESEDQVSDPWMDDLPEEVVEEPARDADDFASLLTEEERQKMAQGDASGSDDLLEMLKGGIELEEMANDPSGASMDDLLSGLSEEAGMTRIPPQADSGDDRKVEAGDDGTAIITLDGSGTHDPHELVRRWSWKDSSGREIADTSRMKVKLSRGHHRFELSVLDADGVWTTDTTFIIIE